MTELPPPVGEARSHDSALAHALGSAHYTDDIPVPADTLHIALGYSPHARARFDSIDLAPVRAAPGVVCVLSAADIPGSNDYSPIAGDDPIFADGEVHYHGQVLFAAAASTLEQARHACTLAQIEWAVEDAVIDLEAALAADADLLPPRELQRGDWQGALASAPHRLDGRLRIGGQDHFYLEGQIALALPGDDGTVVVHSSTQHPSEVQHKVAAALALPDRAVTVSVRRMGGGFGGKESQPALLACVAALVARHTARAAKLRLDRDEDMRSTGKRHDCLIDYRVGYDDDGRLLAVEQRQALRCGYSADLSAAIADRAMYHADNCYFLPALRVHSRRCRTHTVSNTAFRGFGGPQGMLGIEQVIAAVAAERGLDPLQVRLNNCYGPAPRDTTHYGMAVEGFCADRLLRELAESADYRARRAAVEAFNAVQRYHKRGIALTPVKFGISFTTSHLNQAGALVQIYSDGSVLLNHGGTEMGQGLYTKVRQIVAAELGVPLAQVGLSAARTDKVPNTSATAASSGTDLNGMAAQRAARTLRERLAAQFAERHGCEPAAVRFAGGEVFAGEQREPFAETARRAWLARVSLSATGFYATPHIHTDPQTLCGRPFYYFACGAALSEVIIDTLTGEYRVERIDVLHDVGRSINPAIDTGQVLGGLVQGMGWLTTEELWWDSQGALRTHAPSTYKIPTAGDIPAQVTVRLWEEGENSAATVHRSKAVGEPPLMLAISVFQAIQAAVMACAPARTPVLLDAPATPERVLMAIEALRAAGGARC